MVEYFNFKDIFSKTDQELIQLNNKFADFYLAAAGESPPLNSEPVDAGGWMVFGMYFSMGTRHDYRHALKSVQSPVLVIHGSDDLQSAETSKQYADLFPNADFQIIQGADHFPYYSQSGTFSDLVAEFLNR